MGNLYTERDIIEQKEFYTRHVSAMTKEGLDRKSDIAAELAHRDITVSNQQKHIEALQARVAELERIIDGVGDALGVGSNARTEGTLVTCTKNTRHFTDKLWAVEREFFMIPGDPDEEFPDEAPEPVCELNSWSSTRDEYVAQFGAALKRKQAEELDKLKSELASDYPVKPYIRSILQSIGLRADSLREEAEKP